MQVDDLARQRFESFKLGMPSTNAPVGPEHRHRRSHSRNASISSISSLQQQPTTPHETSPTQSLPVPPKRNSHHRRRSSVSTRRESAEIMGVSHPDAPNSPAEDPAEMRRNALWALEGKRDATVEIPELPAPFEFPTKPSPPGSGSFTAKRDSFKPSLSAKDCLHTLVEEEEPDDEGRAPPTPTTPTTMFRARARPPHLRPLSLTPDSLPAHNPPTPNSAKRSSLKALSLTPDSLQTEYSPSATRPRPVLNLKLLDETYPESPEETSARPKPLRKSSISYKISSNAAGLPTPETTPTCSERRFSMSSNSISSRGSMGSEEAFVGRPFSVSEQHFLFKSHNALLARITDLERVLSFRNNGPERGSRPSSVASGVSVTSRSSSPDTHREEPIDEMVSLVSDLKAERDELKRDVQGWRTRVADLEKQLTVFTNRVEVERREAWVARTQVGILETERNGLAKRVAELQSHNEQLVQNQDDLYAQIARLQGEKETLALELRDVKNKVPDPLSTPRAFDGPFVAMKPVASSMKRGLGFASLDSEASATDVEDSLFQSFTPAFKLRAVEEEADDGLAGYEDEDENDVILSPSSSFGSVDDFYATHPSLESPIDPAPATHVPKLSLSKWTFPKNVTPKPQAEPEVDRFFGCLDDLDAPPSPNSPNYGEYDEEKSKGLFAQGFNCSDAKSCFVLPAEVLSSADATFVLDAVVEEEDEETEGETVVDDAEPSNNSGIKITFTPPLGDEVDVLESPLPVPEPSPSPRSVPTLTFFAEDEDATDEEPASPKPAFSFGRSPATPPSSIPRLVTKSSPTSPNTVSPLSFVTPPTKRGGTLPSLIPQPSSPSRISSPPSFSTNASTKSSTTFIRQPTRQPLLPSRGSYMAAQTTDAGPHVTSRYANDAHSRPGAGLKVAVSGHHIPTGESAKASAASSSESPSSLASSAISSIMSSPIRLSSFTSYLPSWGTTAAAHDSTPVAGPAKRGFVSKQSQLDRLKMRLEQETNEGSRSAVGRKGEDEAMFS